MSPSDVDISQGPPSLLLQLMRLLEQDDRFKVSYEDLTGLCRDIADLRLPEPRHWHTCSFCQHAKFANGNRSFKDCRLNKRAVNRRAIRMGAGWAGTCHLGMTEVVQPVTVGGAVVGVLYYGSVVEKGKEAEAKRRIARYCARRGFAVEPYLRELRHAPRADASELVAMRERAVLAAELMARLIEGAGAPLERYEPAEAQWLMQMRRDTAPIVRAAMRYITAHFDEPLTVGGVARRLNCHPDYLTRAFKASHGISPRNFLVRVRVDRARRMLVGTDLGVGEIAYGVGFSTHSHFTKVFREVCGMTPGEYRSANRS